MSELGEARERVKEVDHGWKKFKEQMKLMDKSFVKVGILSGAGDHKDKKGASINMVELATVHEYGAVINHPGGTPYIIENGKAVFVSNATAEEYSGGTVALRRTKPHRIIIPARPFLSQAYEKYFAELKSFVSEQKQAVIEGKLNVEAALKRIGVFFVGKVKLVFTEGTFAQNSRSTIARKGSSRPLTDTARLKQSINYEVELVK